MIVAAYVYLAYMLFTFGHYDEVALHFRQMDFSAGCAFAICILLFPLNISIESWKWRYLLQDIYPMGMREAQRQVYFGTIGAVLTPDRLGDYPTRATRIADQSKWLPAIALGFVGSFALSLVNIFLGLIALIGSGISLPGRTTEMVTLMAAAGIIILFLLLALLPTIATRLSRRSWGHNMQSLLHTLAVFPRERLAAIIGQSACRYLVFAFQYVLMLIFCGVQLPLSDYLIAVPVYYMLVTLSPKLSAADVAVKGGISLFVFQFFADNANAASVALATTLLWFVNNVFPMLIGTWMSKKSA